MSFTNEIRTATRHYVAMITQHNQEIADFEKIVPDAVKTD